MCVTRIGVLRRNGRAGEDLPFFANAEVLCGTACCAVPDGIVDALLVLRLQLEDALRGCGFLLEIDDGGHECGRTNQGQESELGKEGLHGIVPSYELLYVGCCRVAAFKYRRLWIFLGAVCEWPGNHKIQEDKNVRSGLEGLCLYGFQKASLITSRVPEAHHAQFSIIRRHADGFRL